MGKQSTRENKNIYQLCREEQGLTREKASERMVGISASRIEKIEYELQKPTLYDIVQMADCYKRPNLCNYYCSHRCAIGDRYVPEVEVSELSNIILETIASLNEINPLTGRLIQIARDGKNQINSKNRQNHPFSPDSSAYVFITLLPMFSTAPPSPASPTASSKSPDPFPALPPLSSPVLSPHPLSSENKTSLQIFVHSFSDHHQ